MGVCGSEQRGIMAITDSLQSYYKCDEASGNLIDIHGGLDLTETGGTIASVSGKVGNARDFELADTEYFTRADEAAHSMGNIDFSVQAWAKVESDTDFGTIIAKGNLATNDVEYYLIYRGFGGADLFEFTISDSVNGNVSTQWSAQATTGTWYHIIGYHDATANTIGIVVDDGVPVTSAWTFGSYDSGHPLRVGADATPGSYYDGIADEIGIWKKVLSATEITALYNGGDGFAYPFLAGGFFPFFCSLSSLVKKNGIWQPRDLGLSKPQLAGI